MRVALVAKIFAPYRVPLWNVLAGLCDLHLILFAENESDRDWNVKIDRLEMPVVCLGAPSFVLPHLKSQVHVAWRRVIRELDRISPEVVITGPWSQPGFWAAQDWAYRKHVPSVMWTGSSALSSRTIGFRPLDALKRRFVRKVSAFYAESLRAVDYFAYFGAPRDRIVASCYVTDVSAFPSCDRIGDGPEPVLLYVGQFIPRKGVLQMMTALSGLCDLRWSLVVAGSGPLEGAMRDAALKGGFTERVKFIGYVQHDRLSEVYRSADILLFPSLNEEWGLVVNEALLSGLYVIGSDRASATLELISPGLNGDVVAPDNIRGLAAGMRKAIRGLPYDRRRIRATAEKLTPEWAAGKIQKALEIARSAPARHHTSKEHRIDG